MQNRILFLTLNTFSATGGIEKVSRMAGKALHESCVEAGNRLDIYSMYDETRELDEKYFPVQNFRGFGGKRTWFVLDSIRMGRKANLVLLSHINLLSIGYLIKILSPKTKVLLFAHGIEVWQPLPVWKKRMLRNCDLILPVSRYTKEKMQHLFNLEEKKLSVLNNCIDPFLPQKKNCGKCPDLLNKYGLKNENKILLTLTRLSFKERYKGYDEVIMALKVLSKEDPSFRYLIVGKYDQEEKERLERLISQQGLSGTVIFTGFVKDEELAAYFNLADVYVMPSKKEGFGIVFIEALYYGKPVIAGNADGSVDAVANGKLGLLINPDQPYQIVQAIKNIFKDLSAFTPDQNAVTKRFGFEVYKKALLQIVIGALPTTITCKQSPKGAPSSNKIKAMTAKSKTHRVTNHL